MVARKPVLRFGYEKLDFADLTYRFKDVLDPAQDGRCTDEVRFRSRELCARLIELHDARYARDESMRRAIRSCIGRLQAAVGDQEGFAPPFPEIGCKGECGFTRAGLGWKCTEGTACGWFIGPGDEHFEELGAYYRSVEKG